MLIGILLFRRRSRVVWAGAVLNFAITEFSEVRLLKVLGSHVLAALLVRLPSVPTFLKDGPYRFFCYSNEGNEPPHVHIERDKNTAKFWLEDPVRFARSKGFAAHELTQIQSLVEEHRAECLRKWDDHFSGR